MIDYFALFLSSLRQYIYYLVAPEVFGYCLLLGELTFCVKMLWRYLHDLSVVKFFKISVLILPLEMVISHKISRHSDRLKAFSATCEFWGDLEFILCDNKT